MRKPTAAQTASTVQVLLAWALALASLSYTPQALAQEFNPGYDLPVKQGFSLYSSVLKENRFIESIVPPDYKAEAREKHDVIYVLDGIRAYHAVALDYLRGEGLIPRKTVVVGLLGSKDSPTRYRDFTPTRVSSTSGGAEQFLNFLETELIPHVNKTYHTDSEKSTLIQS